MGSIRKKTMSKDRILGRHLLLLVFIKIVILYGLWYVFIKPNKIKVDVSDVQRLYQGGHLHLQRINLIKIKGVSHD